MASARSLPISPLQLEQYAGQNNNNKILDRAEKGTGDRSLCVSVFSLSVSRAPLASAQDKARGGCVGYQTRQAREIRGIFPSF